MAHDLSHACWRCSHWGGFLHEGANHSNCSRMNASPVQASPASGCAYWTPGAGDSLPAGWTPVGFKPWDGPRIYGKQPDDARPPAQSDERPFLPCDQFEFDQKSEAAAWRLAGEALNRCRLNRSYRPSGDRAAKIR